MSHFTDTDSVPSFINIIPLDVDDNSVRGRHLASRLRCCLECPLPTLQRLGSSSVFGPNSSFPSCKAREAANNGSRIWIPVALVEAWVECFAVRLGSRAPWAFRKQSANRVVLYSPVNHCFSIFKTKIEQKHIVRSYPHAMHEKM